MGFFDSIIEEEIMGDLYSDSDLCEKNMRLVAESLRMLANQDKYYNTIQSFDFCRVARDIDQSADEVRNKNSKYGVLSA